MNHNRVASVIFAGAATFHAARVVWEPDMGSWVPPWASGLMAVVAAWIVLSMVRNCPDPMPWQHAMSGTVYSGIMLLHLSRLFRDPEILGHIPMWVGYIAAPTLWYLSAWNWNRSTPGSGAIR